MFDEKKVIGDGSQPQDMQAHLAAKTARLLAKGAVARNLSDMMQAYDHNGQYKWQVVAGHEKDELRTAQMT